jgi:hypothetical protein
VDKIKEYEITGHVLCTREIRNVHKISVRKDSRKRTLGRPRHKWENNIKRKMNSEGY